MNTANEEACTTIAEYSPTARALAELRTKYADAVFDVSTGKGMTVAKEARAELREHRVSLEKERVRIKAPALERCRQIDSEAKRITAELESLEQPVNEQIKGEEDRKALEKAAKERAERERVEAINARFAEIRSLPLACTGQPSDAITRQIAEAEEIDPASFPDDMQAAAQYEKRLAITAMRAALDRQMTAEEERAELERLRTQQAEVREREEAVARAELAAAEKAASEQRQRDQATREEEIRKEATAQAELDKADAVRQAWALAAKQAADAEAVRQTEAAKIQAEQERREADRAHTDAVNRIATDALITGGLIEGQAKQVVALIAAGKVPAVSIAY